MMDAHSLTVLAEEAGKELGRWVAYFGMFCYAAGVIWCYWAFVPRRPKTVAQKDESASLWRCPTCKRWHDG